MDSAPATVSITVDPVNDAPKLENIEARRARLHRERRGDADHGDDDGHGRLAEFRHGHADGRLQRRAASAEDRLEIRNEGTGAGQIGVSGANVTFGGTTIGTFTGGTGTTPLVVTLNASATPAAAQALVRNVTYRNVSENPSTATRTARFVLTDGDGGTSAAGDARHHRGRGQRRAGRDHDGRVAEPRRGRRARGDRHRR